MSMGPSASSNMFRAPQMSSMKPQSSLSMMLGSNSYFKAAPVPRIPSVQMKAFPFEGVIRGSNRPQVTMATAAGAGAGNSTGGQTGVKRNPNFEKL